MALTEAQKVACEEAFAKYLGAVGRLPEIRAANRQAAPDTIRALAFGRVPYSSATAAGGWRVLTVQGGLSVVTPPTDGNGKAVPYILPGREEEQQ